ncbi:hypothetical protein NST63_20260 [Heyndrickxia sp. FSL W8-0496]|mgnify:CR=1 FL=1|uniref:hypothetical protein n=1 Tax=Heyndrickxia TaxID=2837504 RepID=UPI0030FB7805
MNDFSNLEYIQLGDSIEIIYEGDQIELWEVSIINLSLHRIINKVATEVISREFANNQTNKDYRLIIDSGPYNAHIPRLIKTNIKSVSNGSIHQLVELSIVNLNEFATNQVFIGGVLASISASVIASISKSPLKFVKIIRGKQNENTRTVDIGPNLANLAKAFRKNNKKISIKVKNGDDEVEIKIE